MTEEVYPPEKYCIDCQNICHVSEYDLANTPDGLTRRCRQCTMKNKYRTKYKFVFNNKRPPMVLNEKLRHLLPPVRNVPVEEYLAKKSQ